MPSETSRFRFEPADAGTPPWEIGRPQPAIVDLAETDLIRSPILDVGCGTGENSLGLARLGHTVVGVDASPTAIRIAQAKTHQRRSDVVFRVWDVYRLAALDLRFATVIDSALLHIIADPSRYAAQLAAVVEPGGHVVLLEISDEVIVPFPRISKAEIRATFTSPDWHIDRVTATSYQVVGGEVPAWLGSSPDPHLPALTARQIDTDALLTRHRPRCSSLTGSDFD